MNVGHAAAVLDVPFGTPMGGYVDRPGKTVGVLDPLYLHGVTITDGTRRFGLLVADLIAVNDDLVAALRVVARTVGVDLLWVTATHTHAGPDMGCRPGGGDTPAPLSRLLVSAGSRVLHEAVGAERPASATLQRTMVSEVGGVRTQPQSPQVVPVDVLTITAPAGVVVGAIVSLPVHATVLPASNRLLSSDLHGAVRSLLSDRLAGASGQRPWVVLATGAAGDISTRHARLGNDRAECLRLAAIVVDAVAASMAGKGAPLWGDGPDPSECLRWAERPVRLAPAHPIPELSRRLTDAADGTSMDRRSMEVLRQGADMVSLRDAGGRPYEISIEAVRLGRLRMTAIPGELFLALGEQIAGGSSPSALVLGYGNGYLGYLPDRAAHEQLSHEQLSYEVVVSPVAPGSGEEVVAASLDAIAALSA